MSSLVVLRAARLGLTAPRLARTWLGVTAPWLARTWIVLAVIATLACNVGYGAEYRLARRAVVRLTGRGVRRAAEVAMTMTRGEPSRKPVPAQLDTAPEVPAALNGHASMAAEIFKEDLTAARCREYAVSGRRCTWVSPAPSRYAST